MPVHSFLLSGFASTPALDLDGDAILATSFLADLDSFLREPVIRDSHCKSSSCVVGRVSEIRIDERGLWISAVISTDNAALISELRFGRLNAFSIGFRRLEWEETANRFRVKRLRIQEISLVSDPRNAEFMFTVRELDRPPTFEKVLEPVVSVSADMIEHEAARLAGEFTGHKETLRMSVWIDKLREFQDDKTAPTPILDRLEREVKTLAAQRSKAFVAALFALPLEKFPAR
jgi:HK97 family phage prohead protease